MWEFIKYCLFCLGIAVDASFGGNPDGLSLKTAIVGTLTWFVLTALFVCVVRLISFVTQK